MKRYLILEDGTVFPGDAFGATINTTGGLALYTGATGYQEAITNYSYTGQILAFTYPQQGSTGINRDDYENITSALKGVVIGEDYNFTSHWHAQMTLDAFLKAQRIPGLMNVDVRRLHRHIAQYGNMKASFMDTHDEHAHDQIKALVVPNNQVSQVSTKQPYPSPNVGKNVVVLDLGLKNTVLRELSKRRCNITVLPFDASSALIETLAPDGVLISDGPGKPEALTKTIQTIKEIQGHYPIFAIGLGFAVVALANDVSVKARTVTQHRINLAVQEKITGDTDFVAQNSAFYLEQQDDLKDLLPTYLPVSAAEVVGFRHRFLPIYAVNFDPEAAAGPKDALHFFDDFIESMDAAIDRHRREY
ncbi:carbamoyl phosphate synthase small subunit [Lapidilactobacillus mulanensis]|uniref:carbamoyl-phosphate synthase (glutamine-hydrolyzing) n=1 Tax=Lapidilactobacillus mulanensis TaxID=2485999 RepID=A0ABW4DSM0_9LACO|nr:carbamoyl phosphate synthase small subunit [Lapidilactobacillus mulanensis]